MMTQACVCVCVFCVSCECFRVVLCDDKLKFFIKFVYF